MRKIAAFMLIVMVSVGCATKDERARTNLAQTWRISKVFQNNQDVTTTYLDARVNYRLSFTNAGAFQERYLPFSGGDQITVNGTWVFSDGVNKVTLTDGNQTRVYQVDLLDKENFNITDLGSTNNRKIEFVLE